MKKKKYFPYVSDRPSKKFDIITNDNKKVYFGQTGYEHFTEGHLDDSRKWDYISRHRRNENWSDPNTAGFWIPCVHPSQAGVGDWSWSVFYVSSLSSPSAFSSAFSLLRPLPPSLPSLPPLHPSLQKIYSGRSVAAHCSLLRPTTVDGAWAARRAPGRCGCAVTSLPQRDCEGAVY
jgi:hypothetical protein